MVICLMTDSCSEEIGIEDKRIISEFCHLLEKSKQLFNGLRDLPQYGHASWQTYFGRAFDVYTRLWKYQQQHRLLLDKAYGLKRWQIGEIASKIGQLYYHYYLRTSDTNYLNEAYQFYGAIRARGYYSKKEERSDLTVKKLRYFARFIVVCLLLKRMKVVRELVRELAHHVDDYTSTYEPEDQLEWSLVLSEIRSFIDSDAPVSVIDSEGVHMILSHRLTPTPTPASSPPPLAISSEKPSSSSTSTTTGQGQSQSHHNHHHHQNSMDHHGHPHPHHHHPWAGALSLQEILVVGTKSDQVKFSELTMDMYRMIQTFERETQDELLVGVIANNSNPSGSGGPMTTTTTMMMTTGTTSGGISIGGTNTATRMTPPRTTGGGSLSCLKRENPHKYLLYRPSLESLFVYLCSAWRDLDPNGGVLLIYLSGDSGIGRDELKSSMAPGYGFGGVSTLSKKEDSHNKLFKLPYFSDQQCFYPGDLIPFTRKPLFLIIDSESAHVFKDLSSPFGAPLLILMSPNELPGFLMEAQVGGSLFTLFLHCPLSGFCIVSGISSVSITNWEFGQTLIDRFLSETLELISRGNGKVPSLSDFLGDDFLRLLILRFIFCSTVLFRHRSFQSNSHQPRSLPDLSGVSSTINLQRVVLELASHFGVGKVFIFEQE